VNRDAEPVFAIPAADLQWARAQHAASGRSMTELLEEKLGCGPAELVARLGATLRMAPITLEALRAARPDFDLLPYAEAARRGCAALRVPGGAPEVVLGDPFALETQDWIEACLPAAPRYRLAHRLELAAWLAELGAGLRALDGVAAGIPGGGALASDAEEISYERISADDSTVVRLVNSTLYDALRTGASDIHLESTATGLTIKYRVDGVLTPGEAIPGPELAEQAVSRVKVMAELDIAERRVPQDGRFRARRDGREIDVRVSVMPSVFGEDAVLRILDKQSLTDQLHGLSLDSLGFSAAIKQSLRSLATQPHGMLLVTGPTGSGKTTTLYAVITEINKGLDKIITIEDPVEYQLPGVLQIPVNEQKGLSFARGLRSILRHDPDRIMVGEIRDPETAEIAVQSALTGHLVYTTVHANNVFDVLGRFLHMGVDTYSFASALNAVLAQRLLRLTCRACAGRGCAECRGSGYRGRKAVGELLLVDDALRELIVAREPARRLKEAARAAGTVSLREAALALVAAGETTREEVDRVTFVA
jgi:general secretion pathway protein E